MRKVYAVVGSIPWECEDVLGIYTSKAAAVKAANVIANRKVDYYADYTNYYDVAVYAVALNTVAKSRFLSDDAVYTRECGKRLNKRKADSEKSYGKKIYSKNKVDGDGYSRNDPTVERY
jgi:hypothetical protein